MRKSFTFLATTAMALCLAGAATAEETGPGPETVVATVNGTEIKLGHMILAREALPPQYQQLPNDVLFKGILDQLVEQVLLAEAYGAEDPARIRIALENERRAMLASETVRSIVSTAVSESALEEAYKARYADAEPSREYNASHILVETEDEAKVIIAELGEGADFAELAKTKSTGPSGPSGGELGWFGPGMMVAPFEEAVILLDKGKVSAPVKTRFGWHVIKLNDTRLAEAPSMEEVRAELEDEVTRAAVEARIEALSKEASIDRSGESTLDPSLLTKIDLLEN